MRRASQGESALHSFPMSIEKCGEHITGPFLWRHAGDVRICLLCDAKRSKINKAALLTAPPAVGWGGRPSRLEYVLLKMAASLSRVGCNFILAFGFPSHPSSAVSICCFATVCG